MTMSKIKLALKIDLVLQAIPLAVILVTLSISIVEKMWLIFTLLGFAVLGVVQLTSVFCFITWLNDMVRVKYLVACLIYGVLFIIGNFVLDSNFWEVTVTALSLPMAIFYFWYSWKFYTLNFPKEKRPNAPPSPPTAHPQSG